MSSRAALSSAAMGWPTKAEKPGCRQASSLATRSWEIAWRSRRRARRCSRNKLPFFRNAANGLLKAALQGWQVAGIATFWSGVAVPADTERQHQRRPAGLARQPGRRPVRKPAGRRARVRLLLQPGRVRAAGGRAVRGLRACPLPGAGRQPVGPHSLEELVPAPEPPPAAPGRLHQRAQPHPARDARGRLQHARHHELPRLRGQPRPHHDHPQPPRDPARRPPGLELRAVTGPGGSPAAPR